MPFEELVLVHCSVRAALTTGTVVGDDDDDRVVQLAGLLQIIDDPAQLVVGVGDHAGVHLGHAGEETPFVVVQRFPRVDDIERRPGFAVGARCVDQGVHRRQLGVGRNDAHLPLTCERLLASLLVTVVETALVAIGPLRCHVVRSVGHTRAVVHEERFVGRDLLGVGDEFDRLVRDVGAEVVAVLGLIRLIDRMVVVHQVGGPLTRLGAEESVEALEPAAEGPVALGGRQVHLVFWAQVPLAQHVGVVAPLHQHLGDRGRLGRDVAIRVWETLRGLTYAGHADRGGVAARQHRRSRRRAECGGVELGVPQSPIGDSIQGRGVDWATEGGEGGEPDVVPHHVEHVRRPLGWFGLLVGSPVGL